MGNNLGSERKQYYKNGKLWKRYIIKNGQYDGLYQEWWPNGKLHLRTCYNQGKQNGPFLKFDPLDGSKTNHMFYDDDKEHGELKCWNDRVLIKHGLAEHGVLIMMFKGELNCCGQ